jgi:site-specific DNA-methyltransferase (adenine-specific)
MNWPDDYVNQVIQGDCLEVMKGIPDGVIDMILADLPYGTTDNKWDSAIPVMALWARYKRIIKPNGAIVLTAMQPFTTTLISSNLSWFKYSWVWDKANPTGFLNAKKQPLRVTEDVLVFYRRRCVYNPEKETRGKPRNKGRNKPGMTASYGETNDNQYSFNNEYYPTNLIRISNANRSSRLHPTQKPTDLFEYLIRTYTNEGDIVLDNTIGSGTTAVAAINTNRRFVGIELDAEYCEIARKRVNDARLALDNIA